MKRTNRKETRTPTLRPLTPAQLPTVVGGQKIETIWKEGNIAAHDDWQSV